MRKAKVRTRSIVLASIVIGISSASGSALAGRMPHPQRASAADSGFVPLFNGRDLPGWKVPPGDNGHWTTFEITVRRDHLTVVLNGVEVITHAELPGMPARGPIALQHHGEKRGGGPWTAPPSLVQFRNSSIKELP